MRILELFAGSRSIGNVAEKLGMEVFSSDIEAFDKIDYIIDILNFDVSKVPWQPDIIWASPPCTFFSVASIGKHWHIDNTPKTEQAILGMKIVKATVAIIDHFKPQFFYVENPRGKLRKLDLLPGTLRTITYCQYGDTRMKPTDIWTNNLNWAPRGSKTGTQGIDGAYNRSKIPSALCHEILRACMNVQQENVNDKQLQLF